MKAKGRVWILSVVGIVVVIGVLAGIKVGQIRAMIDAGKSFVPPPEAVTSAKVENAVWQARRTAIGSLVAVHDAVLGAETPGLVREVSFESGKNVKQGAVLVKLDTSNEEAQLAAAKADAALAKATADRATVLRKGGANTPADVEAAEARVKQTEAVVKSLEATIAKKTIRAPFAGRVAIRQVERGQVVAPGTPIATLQSVDPIYAEFALPQQALADLKDGQAVTVTVDSFPGSKWQGRISTVDSQVDPVTRNVRVRATVPNKDGRLRAGLYVNVEVLADGQQQALVIPATSIMYAPFGDSVFVLKQAPVAAAPSSAAGGSGGPSAAPAAAGPELVAEPRFVRLGERRGDLVAVLSGLEAGETVVSNGAFKLRKGMKVVVNNALAPKVDADPKPVEQ